MITVDVTHTSEQDLVDLAKYGVQKLDYMDEGYAAYIMQVCDLKSIVDVYGRVWAVLGVRKKNNRIGEAFMMIHPHAKNYPHLLVGAVRKALKMFPQKATYALVDKPTNERFAALFGFKKVGMVKVLDKEYARMERIES